MVSTYDFYVNGVLLPVAPSSMSVKIKNQNTTVNLINDGEVSILKKPGLTEYSFEVLLPNQKYPFAKYVNGYVTPKHYLDEFEKLKTEKTPFTFIVSRTTPKGKGLFDTSTTVTLEDYTIKEDAKEGFDVKVSLNFKQYKKFQTKTCSVTIQKSVPFMQSSNDRAESSNAPSGGGTYTVVKGDCLWKIAKYFYGNGSDWQKIYNANISVIGGNPNLIYPGQVITIP
jgi:LysM repeat protein